MRLILLLIVSFNIFSMKCQNADIDQRINFKDVFVILNKEKTSYGGRLGIDFDVSLIVFNDSIFRYSFKKIENIPVGDHIIMDYEYPELTISKMDITPNGKVVDLVIEH